MTPDNNRTSFIIFFKPFWGTNIYIKRFFTVFTFGSDHSLKKKAKFL